MTEKEKLILDAFEEICLGKKKKKLDPKDEENRGLL